MGDLYLKNVTAIGGLRVECEFSDGVKKIYNLSRVLHSNPKYEKLLDEEEFKKFKFDKDFVFWGENQEIMITPVLERIFKSTLM